jgi:WD40 repeat protein
LDAVSGEERHHWGFPARKEISELIQAPYYFTRFHVKGFMGVLGAVDHGTVMMWDLTTNKKMWDAALRYSGIMLRFSPNGDYVLLKDDTVPEIRRTLNGKVVSRFVEKTYGGLGEGEFSPCGKYILFQSDEMMKEKAILWEWKTNRVKQTYAMPVAIKDGNYHVQFSSDGKRVAVATADFCVYEFETMTGKLIRRELVLKDGDTSEFDVECLFQ